MSGNVCGAFQPFGTEGVLFFAKRTGWTLPGSSRSEIPRPVRTDISSSFRSVPLPQWPSHHSNDTKPGACRITRTVGAQRCSWESSGIQSLEIFFETSMVCLVHQVALRGRTFHLFWTRLRKSAWNQYHFWFRNSYKRALLQTGDSNTDLWLVTLPLVQESSAIHGMFCCSHGASHADPMFDFWRTFR